MKKKLIFLFTTLERSQTTFMATIQYNIPTRQCRGSKNWRDMPSEEVKKMVQMQHQWDRNEQPQLEDGFFVPNLVRTRFHANEMEETKELFGNIVPEDRKIFMMVVRTKNI